MSTSQETECAICRSPFDLENEGGLEGSFGILSVSFCPWCLSSLIDMVQKIYYAEYEQHKRRKGKGMTGNVKIDHFLTRMRQKGIQTDAVEAEIMQIIGQRDALEELTQKSLKVQREKVEAKPKEKAKGKTLVQVFDELDKKEQSTNQQEKP